MLPRISSIFPFRVKPTELHSSPSDDIFVITRRRPRPSDIDVELSEMDPSIPQHPTTGGENAQRGEAGLQLHSNPVYLKTQFDIMYYLGLSPLKGDGQCGSQFQRVEFYIITSLAILKTLLRLKQFIVNHVEKGNLLHYITAWYLATRLILQMFFAKIVSGSSHQMSNTLQDLTRIKSDVLYKFASTKVSKVATALACLRIIMAIASSTRPDLWLAGQSPDFILRARSYEVSTYLFLWIKNNSTEAASDELYTQYAEEMPTSGVIMGIAGLVLQFVSSLQLNIMRDTLLMTALHTFRLSQIFQCNMHNVIGNDMPNNQNLPLLRKKHVIFYQMINKIEISFGGFFKMLHVVNYVFCADFLLDILQGEANNVFLPETIVSIPGIAFTYIFAAKAFSTSQEVHHLVRDRDCDNEVSDVQSNKIAKFLEKLKNYPIALGRGNFIIDDSFVQKFVGLAITSFLLFEDTEGKNAKA